jgi:uncharacterized membrane protein
MITTLPQVSLLLATLLCSLVTGFLFAFAVVVMLGIAALDDAGFLRAFQVIDRVIQNCQLFVRGRADEGLAKSAGDRRLILRDFLVGVAQAAVEPS